MTVENNRNSRRFSFPILDKIQEFLNDRAGRTVSNETLSEFDQAATQMLKDGAVEVGYTTSTSQGAVPIVKE